MGVKGLWQLLLPTGRRISIETLAGKKLAIDASIWLTQFLKANRDPDTGSVRPAAHLLGFIRRICKLLYFGILPVFVFDGATPEIKLREIRARRERRERLQGFGGENGIGEDDDRGVKRMARRILIAKLKEQKEVEMANERVVKGKKVKDSLESVLKARNKSKNGTNNASLAPGFRLPVSKEERENNDDNDKTNTNDLSEKDQEADGQDCEELLADTEAYLKKVSNEDQIQNPTTTRNDWDDAISVESNSSDESHNEEDNMNIQLPNDTEDLDPDALASLPSNVRTNVFENAQRQQRLTSRKEFMSVAANPDRYSQTQLRNFLKSSTLNKKIHEVGARVANTNHNNGASKKSSFVSRGERIASDATRRIHFKKSNDDDETDEEVLSSDRKQRTVGKYHTNQNDSGEESSEVEWEEGLGEGGNETSIRNEGSLKRKNQETSLKSTKKRKKLTIDSDSSSDGDDGGGFLKPNNNNDVAHPSELKCYSLSGSDGGFLKSNNDVTGTYPSELKCDSSSDSGGGFLKEDNDDNLVLGTDRDGFSKSDVQEAVLKSMHRQLVTIDTDEDSDDSEGGGGFLPSNDYKDVEIIGEDDMDNVEQSSKKEEKVKEIIADQQKVITLDDNSSSDDSGGGFLKVNDESSHKTNHNSNDGENINVELDHVDGGGFSNMDVQKAILQSTHQQILSIGNSVDSDENSEGGGFLRRNDNNDVDFVSEHKSRCNQDREDITNKKMEGTGTKSDGHDFITFHSDEPFDDDKDCKISDNNDQNSKHGFAPDVDKAAKKVNSYNEIVDFAQQNSMSASDEPPFDGEQNESGNIQQATTNAPNFGESSDENIDWEDGDDMECEDIETHEKSGKETASTSIDGEQNESANIQQATTDAPNFGESSDESIDCEDGDDMECEDSETHEKSGKETASTSIDNSSGDDDDVQIIGKDTTGEGEIANAYALKQAETTAANLTNWAGRAVRRAIAAHLEDSGVSVQPEMPSPTSNNSPHAKVDQVQPSVHHKIDSPEPRSAEQASPKAATSPYFLNPVTNGTSYDELRDEDERLRVESNKQQRDMDTVTDEMKEEIMQLLQLFGVPYVEAPAEAEAQCVVLENLGLVDGVVTEDSDAVVFGSKCVYKNCFDDQKYAEAYFSSDAEKLGIGQNEKVALAMLLGGDYTDGVKGVGIVNGMEILQAFPVSNGVKEGLSAFRKWLEGFDPADEIMIDTGSSDMNKNREQLFHKKHRSARTRWIVPKDFPAQNVLHAYTKPVVDTSKDKFSWGVPDLIAIRLFCASKIGWDKEETDRNVVPVIKQMESGQIQTRLDGYFMRSEDDIKFAKVKSKRLREVLNLSSQSNNQESTS